MRRKGSGSGSGAQSPGNYASPSEPAWSQGDHDRRKPGGSPPLAGPRLHRRTDDKIQEDILELLTNNADLDAREIEVHVEGGEVTLTGSVDSRDARWLTEDLVTSVS